MSKKRSKTSDYGAYISPSFFEEGEYKTTAEMLVANYIIVNSDMAGVCSINRRLVAAKCKIKQTNLDRIIRQFEKIGKLFIGTDGVHIWWKSKTYHALYKGNCSPTQKKKVQTLVKQWNNRGIFVAQSWHNSGIIANNFAEYFLQHYESKYDLVIPYPQNDHRGPPEPEPEPESETEPKRPAVDNSRTGEPELPLEPPAEEEDGRFDLKNQGDGTGRTDGQEDKIDYHAIRDYFEKKFGEEISNENIDRLISGDPKIKNFKGMGNYQTLVFAIANYKSKIKPRDPVALLIDIGKDPDKYFQGDMLKSYHQQGVKPLIIKPKTAKIDGNIPEKISESLGRIQENLNAKK